MMNNQPPFTTISQYIALYPKPVQTLLRNLRQAIATTAPQATEAISYGIPTFKWHGNLVHFAAYKGHIGFYPGSAAIVAFKKDLQRYTLSKGTIQFPLDKPLPLALVKKIVRYRLKQNLTKAK